MIAIFQKIAMMVCSLFKVHDTQEFLKNIVSEDQSEKRISLIREVLFVTGGRKH